MTTTTFSEAKAKLSAYARMAESGKTVLVTKHHRPAFVIAPVTTQLQGKPKKFGLAKGKGWMAPDFDKTPDWLIRAFEGDL